MIRGYNQDFFEWTQETAQAIEAGHFDEIDLVALADEVASLGKRDRREVGSRLGVIVMHLLKIKYQPEQRTPSWDGTIREQRRQLTLILNDSPSLRVQLPNLLADYYPSARLDAANETGLDLDAFPESCEWSVAEVLSEANKS